MVGSTTFRKAVSTMAEKKCATCYRRDNCGNAFPARFGCCNSYLNRGEVYEDEMDRNRTERERREYAAAYELYADDDFQ